MSDAWNLIGLLAGITVGFALTPLAWRIQDRIADRNRTRGMQ